MKPSCGADPARERAAQMSAMTMKLISKPTSARDTFMQVTICA
jgi:hypothetical protein